MTLFLFRKKISVLRWVALSSALVVALLWGACVIVDGPCEKDSDCQSGQKCLAGACAVCAADTDCAAGQRCVSQRCIKTSEEKAPDAAPQERAVPVEPTAPDAGPDRVVTPPDATPDDVVVEQEPDRAPLPPTTLRSPQVCKDSSNCCVPNKLRGFLRGETAYQSPYRLAYPALGYSPNGRYLVTASADSGYTILRKGVAPYAVIKAWSTHAQGVWDVTFSPDSTVLATLSYDRTVKLWEVPSGRLLATLSGHTNTIYNVAFSPDGRYVGSCSADRSIRIYEAATGKYVRRIVTPTLVRDLAFDSNSKYVAAAGDNKIGYVFDVNSSSTKPIAELKGHTARLRAIAFSPDGTKVATGSDDRNVSVWNVASPAKPIKSLNANHYVFALAFSQDGKSLAAAAGLDRSVRVWETSKWALRRRFTGPVYYVHKVVWAPDNKTLFSASEDLSVWFHDVDTGSSSRILNINNDFRAPIALSKDGTRIVVVPTGTSTALVMRTSDDKKLFELKGHTGRINDVAISNDGSWIVTGSVDKTVRVWNANDGKLVKTLTGHTSNINAVAISPNGMLIASGGNDKQVRVWEIDSGKTVYILNKHLETIRDVTFSENGLLLGTASDDGTAKIWQVANGQLEQTLSAGLVGPVYAVAFHSNNKTVATAGYDRNIYTWDVTTGSMLKSWGAHSSLIRDLTFLPGSDLLLSASFDRWIRLWDAKNGVRHNYIGFHQNNATHVAYDPKTKLVYSGSWDFTVGRWRMENQAKKRFDPIGFAPLSMTMSPDGQWLALTSDAGQVGIWRVSDGRRVRVWTPHNAITRAVRFSKNSQFVFTASDNADSDDDQMVKMWRLSDGSLVHTFAGHKDRVIALALSPDGKLLASGGWNSVVRVWDIAKRQQLYELKGTGAYIYSLKFSPDGKLLAGGHYSKEILVWELATQKVAHTLASGVEGKYVSLAFSLTGTNLYAATLESRVIQFRLSDNRLIRYFQSAGGPLTSMSIRGDSNYLITGSRDNTLRVFRASDGSQYGQIDGHTAPVVGVAYGADGMVYSASEDGSIRSWHMPYDRMGSPIVLASRKHGVSHLAFSSDGAFLMVAGEVYRTGHWDVAARSNKRTLYGPDQPASALAASADGALSALASENGSLYIWQNSNGARKQTIKDPHPSPAGALAFTVDGKLLLSAGGVEPTIKIWDVGTGKTTGSISRHGAAVVRLAFTTKGDTLLSASKDNTVRLWDPSDWSLKRTLSDVDGQLVDADISGDGSKIAAATASGKLQTWKGDGSPIASVSLPSPPRFVRLGGSGDWVAVLMENNVIQLYATQTLELAQSYSVQGRQFTSLDAPAAGGVMAASTDNGFFYLWGCQ